MELDNKMEPDRWYTLPNLFGEDVLKSAITYHKLKSPNQKLLAALEGVDAPSARFGEISELILHLEKKMEISTNPEDFAHTEDYSYGVPRPWATISFIVDPVSASDMNGKPYETEAGPARTFKYRMRMKYFIGEFVAESPATLVEKGEMPAAIFDRWVPAGLDDVIPLYMPLTYRQLSKVEIMLETKTRDTNSTLVPAYTLSPKPSGRASYILPLPGVG